MNDAQANKANIEQRGLLCGAAQIAPPAKPRYEITAVENGYCITVGMQNYNLGYQGKIFIAADEDAVLDVLNKLLKAV